MWLGAHVVDEYFCMYCVYVPSAPSRKKAHGNGAKFVCSRGSEDLMLGRSLQAFG